MSKIDELLKNEKVEWKKIGEIKEVKVISPKRKIKKNEYLEEGLYPIIDQGQKFIVGYTNDINAIFERYSYVIFGDHTETLKYVDFQFAQGADGIKVLKTDETYLYSRYLYYAILNFYEKMGEYKRHFSFLKETLIPIPSIETQKKIVKILDKFTNCVSELQAELQARTKQYEYYRDMLLSEEYLNKLSEELECLSQKEYVFKTVFIEEVAKIKNGKDWKSLGEGNIPVYGSGGKMGVYVDQHAYDKPSVLIPRKGSIENVFYVDEPFWNVDTIFYTEINDKKIIPKYFYYFIENYDISKLSTDSTRPSLTQSILNKVKIDLPPLEIQNKVIQILDSFQSLLSDTKGLLPQEIEQRQKQYEYYREKLLTFDVSCAKHTHTHTHNIISNSYFVLLKEAADIVGIKLFDVEWKALGRLGVFENGTGMPKSLFTDNGTVGAIHYGHIYTKYNLFVENPIVRIDKNDMKKLKKVNYGDLVIAKTSENIEDVMKTVAYLGNETVVTGGHAAIFRHNENPKYLSYVFNGANYLLSQKNKLAKGVKVIEISIMDMEKIKVPLPSLQVQEYIVSILDKFNDLINDVSIGIPKEIELRQKQYEYYRDKLLDFKSSN